jgi:hypothetical protein
VAHGAYDSEYDFGWDLYQTTQQAHDGHFAYIPNVVGSLFSFGRTTPLVSVSKDGKDLPLVYAYADILGSYAGNSSFEPSHITQTDGIDTTDFLLDWSKYGFLQDQDALWNDMFYSPAQNSLGGLGSGTGTFAGNSLVRFVYPGPTTTLTFANGSNVTNENFARVNVPLSGIESGADIYQKWLSVPPEAYNNVLDVLHHRKENQTGDNQSNNDAHALHHKSSMRLPYVDEVFSSQRHTSTTPAVGYPTPVMRQKQNMNAGYFLEEPGLEDVAVLTVASFYTQGTTKAQDFQKINSDFIAAALAANKTKLIIDVSANAGGLIIQGYDVFKQLFPSIHPYGASRVRAHETIDWLGKLLSTPVNYSDPNSVSHVEKSLWDYHTDLDSDNRPFSSWKQKYGPHSQGTGNDTFTSLIRWDLNDTNIRHSEGIWVSGYGGRSNITHQPFQPQNIVLITDGFCASTCALFSEFLQQEAGVQAISLGGRPSRYLTQSVGGVKGAQAYKWTDILEVVKGAILLADPVLQRDLNETALARYSYLPIARGTGGVNLRDGIRRNDDGQTPLQFWYEPAPCRIFYTKQMVIDQSAVWKTVADTETTGQKLWSVRPDFDIEAAWESLKVETDGDWFGVHGDSVAIV